MNKKHILVVSNPEIMNEELFSWVSSNEEFDMTFAEAHEQAIELCHQRLFDMVLTDITDETINSRMLRAVLPILNVEALLLGYKGESSAELDARVKQAFEIRKLKRMHGLLILDSSMNQGNHGLTSFSLN